LISEGWLRNEQTYGDSVTLRVRLHSLIIGNNAKFFDVQNYVSLENYISSLLVANGKKYQIVNINLSDIDDEFAKVLTKIYSRLIFDFSKGLKERASIPFHIVLEEAHRYIQSDHDRFLFGYNIFERIAKEGRKYGVILGLISQRPVEISDTVISQCTNFLIFKINHPIDVEYIRKMVPNITDEIVEKQKSLQSGTCLGFGLGFKIPLIVKMEMPNPAPLSGNCDVVRIWNGGAITAVQTSTEQAVASVPEVASVESAPVVSVPEVAPVLPLEIPSLPVSSSAPQDVTSENALTIPTATAAPILEIPTMPEEKKEEAVPVTPVMSTTVEVPSQLESSVMDKPEIPLVSFTGVPSQPVAATTTEEAIPDHFDDSFVIQDGAVTNNAVSAPLFPTEPEIPVGLSEIAEVNINSQGMVQDNPIQSSVNLGAPILELPDEDDDEGIDFE
jgi:hypothetical protein